MHNTHINVKDGGLSVYIIIGQDYKSGQFVKNNKLQCICLKKILIESLKCFTTWCSTQVQLGVPKKLVTVKL